MRRFESTIHNNQIPFHVEVTSNDNELILVAIFVKSVSDYPENKQIERDDVLSSCRVITALVFLIIMHTLLTAPPNITLNLMFFRLRSVCVCECLRWRVCVVKEHDMDACIVMFDS